MRLKSLITFPSDSYRQIEIPYYHNPSLLLCQLMMNRPEVFNQRASWFTSFILCSPKS